MSWKFWPAGVGGWPSRPAATWTFCSRDGADHVAGRHVPRRQLLRVEPDAHAVVARAEERDVADAGDAGQLVLDVDRGVVAQVELVELEALLLGFGVGFLLRDQVDAQQDAGRLLLGGDALALHVLGELGLGDLDPVLHQHLGHVQVGAQLERDVEEHLAVVGAARRHVDHVLDAVDLLFDRRGDGVGHDLGVGAGVVGRDRDGGRRHLRVLGDRQLRQGHGADDDDDDRQHGREDRPIDEEV